MNDGSISIDQVWKPQSASWVALRENTRQKIRDWYDQRPILTTLLLGLVVVGLPLVVFAERPLFQEYFVIARRYGLATFLGLLFAVLTWWTLSRWSGKKFSIGSWVIKEWNNSHRAKAIVSICMFGTLAIIMLFGKQIHDYTSQYYRYQTLEIVDLKDVEPETGHERILPLMGVYQLAQERMNENENPSEPDMVREGFGYRWTMAIEPSSPMGRLFLGIEEFLSIPADEPTPDFSRRRPEKVDFNVGETLLFSRNIYNCTRLNFGFWRSLSYETGNVIRAKNDAGQFVQIVTLIKWSGWVWPQPEFGGVQVIEQGHSNFVGRVLWGCGTWIRPEEIKDHKFLVGQNLVPYEVSRNMAESQRFQAGFFGPIKFSGIGDLRIADMKDDVNQQPFTLYFKLPGGEKLYQYLGLEPRDPEKQGLATSLFLPADGIGEKYAIKHYTRQIPIGMTAVAAQVRASRKNYDWSHNAVVEVRPYIHSIADSKGNFAPRFMWMATVVAIKKREPGEDLKFTSGNDPEIVLVDAYSNKVVWVDSQRPDKWPDDLHAALGDEWVRRSF